jgi:hypothetical protein
MTLIYQLFKRIEARQSINRIEVKDADRGGKPMVGPERLGAGA